MILDANAAVVAQAIAHFRDIAEWRPRGAVPRTRPKERRASSRATTAKSCDRKCVFEDCSSIRVFSGKSTAYEFELLARAKTAVASRL
jgi:hypothetical protein